MKKLTVDMSLMFSERLRQLVSDCGDTASRGGLDDDEVGKILVTGLLAEVVIGMLHMEMNEDQFLQVSLKAYREMVKMMQRKRRPGPTVTA